MSELLDRYEAVIGLEVHAQLKTRSKMFSGSAVAFGEPPNTLTDPVVLGMPGVLPVVNEQAVAFGVRLALAVGAEVHLESRFARKHYFYPDLPKGYQISQYEQPLATGGSVTYWTKKGPKTARLIRIHLEEDAGKNMHLEGTDYSLVDFNRAGVPLAEIVSEPDFRSPEEAVSYLRALRQLVRYLGICDGNMEEGSLRCDANLSVRPKGSPDFGIPTELKNLNSFRAVGRALQFELERQAALLDQGGQVERATLLWDANASRTRVLRTKEQAHDYRYFPEPDLPPLVLEEAWVGAIGRELPELPWDRRRRLVEEYGLTDYDAGVLTEERELADYYEATVRQGADPKKASSWIQTELLRLLKEDGRAVGDQPVTPQRLAELLGRMASGELTGRNAKEVFEGMYREGKGAQQVMDDLGIRPPDRDEGAVEALCRQVIAEHPKEAERYRSGRKKLLGFFVGQVMRQDRNQDPKLVGQVFRRLLEEEG